MIMLKMLGVVFSIVGFTAIQASGMDGFIHAPKVNEHVDDVRVNIEDRRTVEVVTAFSRTDAEGTVHTLPVDHDLSLKATLWYSQGVPEIRVELISSKNGEPKTLSTSNAQAFPGQATAVNFSVCGDRIINIYGGTDTGRCADLPPMVKPDQQASNCNGGCTGPYEGMPKVIESRARIAPKTEPGEPLTITGRVVGADGRPRPGVIVFAYHTDRLGIYRAPTPPRSQVSNYQGQLRGWARTDADGRYVFDTIRPGSYPHSDNPQHVHMHVIEPGCLTYAINELQFSDDPVRQQLSEADRKREEEWTVIATPRKTAQGWEVTRDIQLGERVPNYQPCARTQ
jgi:protocatechuate 3,4-dioxygenase beta subunit